MSLSPHEYIRHILDEIDYILTQLSDTDVDSYHVMIWASRFESAVDKLSRVQHLKGHLVPPYKGGHGP